MSFQERRSIVNILGSFLITALYCAYMIQRFPQADAYSPEVFRFWGAFFLLLVPVAIVGKIITYIIFYILDTIATREQVADITDERDKLIEQKAQMNSTYVFALGFLLGVGLLVIDLPPSAMFIILLLSGLLSEIVSEISKFYLYRRGF